MTGVARAAAIALSGLDGAPVMVEAAVSRQLPGIAIVGLPDAALGEAKQRVRHAAQASGLTLTDRFVLINLQPADLPKHGSGFDLAIALAALAVSSSVPAERMHEVAHIGELGLDGTLQRPQGLLTAVVAAQRLGFTQVMVPAICAEEAALVPGIEVIAARNLQGAVNWYRGEDEGWWTPGTEKPERSFNNSGDLQKSNRYVHTPDTSEVVGQDEALEALRVSAAGRHNLQMVGPPGSGKTMLATRLTTVLPDLSDDEAILVSSIASLTATGPIQSLLRRPPYEQPHHTASVASIIGSGQGGVVRPGAVSRASFGVLFLDEAAEFPASVLDALRQPLESGSIDIHRATVRATIPARVQLVLASNPCPCGKGGSATTEKHCSCTPQQKRRYKGKISGPLRDRIDVRLNMTRVSNVHSTVDDSPRITSAQMQQHVVEARAAAVARLQATPWRVNSEVPGSWLRSSRFKPSSTDTLVLDRALAVGNISLRGYDRTLRIAWTISDLSGKNSPGRDEVAQALLLRGTDL